jgi:DNA-binding NtrC family response regulator
MNEKILVVDDDPYIRDVLKTILEKNEYSVLIANGYDSAVETLTASPVDLIISDLVMPDENGMQLLRYCRQHFPDVNVILMTGQGTLNSNVEATRLGAFDYIDKPFKTDKFLLTIANALKERNLLRENIALHDILQKTLNFNFVYQSPQMQQIVRLIEKVAPTEAGPILVLGETGTGKEVVAKTLHNLSHRKAQPFLDINCTSLQANLLENELFGHEKGAFTDAREMKKGLFEIASEGTLFLDEIGDMDQSIQSKLLRVLESKSFFRLGGLRPISTNIRIITATNKNLEKAVKDKLFREDLYYRLKLVTIQIPPLRERKDDIIPLVRFFMTEFNKKFKKNFSSIAPNAEKLFLRYGWFGNVRELRNMIERIILLENDDTIKVRHLPIELLDDIPASGLDEPAAAGDEARPGPEDGMISLEELSKQHIKKVLLKTKNNKSLAAQILGINRKTLWEKLKEFHPGTDAPGDGPDGGGTR